jgi:hypothetical protein
MLRVGSAAQLVQELGPVGQLLLDHRAEHRLVDVPVHLVPVDAPKQWVGVVLDRQLDPPGMTAITWRLAAAFCSNAQVGSRSSPARISAWVITGYGPAPWPRVARQSAHISTVNSPRTLLNGPLVAPQNEQRSVIASSLGSGAGGSWPATGDVATPDPTVGIGMKVALQLHQTPDLGAVHPQIRLDMGRRTDTAASSTPKSSAHRSSGAATGQVRVWSWVSQACMGGSVGEQMFE